MLPAVTQDVCRQNCNPVSQQAPQSACSLSFSNSCYLTHLFTPVSKIVRRHHTAHQVQRLCSVLRQCAHMNVTCDVEKAHVGSALCNAEEARLWSASNWCGPNQLTSTLTVSFITVTIRDADRLFCEHGDEHVDCIKCGQILV